MMLKFSEGLIKTTPFDFEMSQLADRHYSRRTVGARQFCNSGRKLVLRNAEGTVLFVWMFYRPEYRMDDQQGYNCTIFRNESGRKSSEIILEAEQFAVARWGAGRAYTYVDASKIRSVNPGCCFKKAGWKLAGMSKSGKHIFEKYLQGGES